MTQTTIHRATAKDIPDIHKMMGQLCAFHGDTLQIGLDDAQRQLVDTGHLIPLIARRADAALGFAVIEPHWRPMDSSDGWDIAHLFVAERARNQGIGHALIQHTQRLATQNGITRLTIGTAPNNPGAAAAYRAMHLEERTGPAGVQFRIPLPPIAARLGTRQSA